MAFYGHFILDMDRSPGFGPTVSEIQDLSCALFRLGFPSAPRLKRLTSPDSAARRTVLQKVRGYTWLSHCASPVCRHRISGSLSLPSRGPFHLSFTVLSSIGHQVVFSLTGWSPLVPTRFHVPRGTLDSARSLSPFAYGAFTLFGRLFQNRSARIDRNLLRSEPRDWPKPFPVWALPLSLAATYGITFVFSSSAYLDVSVQRVPPA